MLQTKGRRFLGGLFVVLVASSFVFGQAINLDTERIQIDGDWCFIKTPPPRLRIRPEAVILIHGNGQTVSETSSSWEENPASQRLIYRLLAAGYIVAQSNHGATSKNGMWGNRKSQSGVVALKSRLREKYGVGRIHAIAISAGNATLANLILDRRATFDSAVLIVPVLSLESMYRCPGETERVKGIAEAFEFQPAGPCPGDPVRDAAFRGATEWFDPLRRLGALPVADAAKLLRRTRWMSLYMTGDPKVVPSENIELFRGILQRADVKLSVRTLDRPTHDASELMDRFGDDVLQFLSGSR